MIQVSERLFRSQKIDVLGNVQVGRDHSVNTLMCVVDFREFDCRIGEYRWTKL